MHPFQREDAPRLKELPKEGQPKATPKTGKKPAAGPRYGHESDSFSRSQARFLCVKNESSVSRVVPRDNSSRP
ncbi:hypothetical protein DZB91_02395 [Brevibacillus sp. VP]|uniref:Uncharacterized protein n=1 Tax=Brevibacillus laterosporus TaxID=1465 RepID=A0AAP8QDP4_BRELA|nr:hypothetical protein C4A76_01675 [Brevibacillus laterosporus]PPB03110.1 hypothetical protein C4A77_10115 [Brevibacillus laterosporus]RFB38663.1 hypothetical protein DZB91_02395 [Brevibacillus sp. VP]